MKKLVSILILAATPVCAVAAPGPFPDMPFMGEFDFTHEPDLKGGAKSFEQSFEYAPGKASDPVEHMLDAKGRVVRKALKGKTAYIDSWRFDDRGDLVEHTRSKLEEGKPERIFKHNVLSYAAPGKLSGIACEEALSKPVMEPSVQAAAEAANGALTLKLTGKGTMSKEGAEMRFTYGADGRATAMTMKMGKMEASATFQRDAAGNLVGGTLTQGKQTITFTAKYTFDDKGNWTKAEVTMKDQDSKEMALTRTYTRKFTY